MTSEKPTSFPGKVPGKWFLFAVTILPILVAEFLIMYVLQVLRIETPFFENILDVVLLSLVAVPLNYFLIYKRLIWDIEKRIKVEKNLKDLSSSLEKQVAERTMKLADSEAEYHSVLESSPDGILRIDTKGTIRSANRAAHRLLGYRGIELIGQNVSGIIPDDHMKILVEGYITFLTGLFPESAKEEVSAQATRKDGSKVSVELAISECVIAQKIFFVIMMKDITERIASQEALKKSEDQLRVITRSVHDGVVMLDGKGKICFWNPAAERIFGFSPEEAVGKRLLDLIVPPAAREGMKRGLEQFGSTGTGGLIGTTREVVGIKKTGEAVTIELSMASILMDGEWHAVGTVRDVTDKKRDLLALQLSKEEAEEATRLKDKFLSLVSHDLRGPIGNVVGFLQLVLSDDREKLPDRVKDILKRAVDSSNKMSRLIEDLLAVGRFKAGKNALKRRFLEARHVAEKAVSQYEQIAAHKGIKIENKLPPNMRVFADETLLLEVLNNLLSNAVKFSRNNGMISIYRVEGRDPVIAVSDTGTGMGDATLKKIFKYEEQTSTLGTQNEIGSGLGLPLCHEIVKAHGGELWASSSEGKGSVFFVRLPHARPRVLLVDDEAGARFLARENLAGADLEVIDADGGRAALELMRNEKIDLVISNMRMPDMDGLELLTRVKDDPSLTETPFIMLTSDSGMETRENALRMGASDFSVKPVNANDLVPRILKVFS